MADHPEGGAAMESNPSEIGPGSWASAENAAGDIIRKLQPNSDSEERRWEVVDYIQRLMRNCFGAEVFPYGSVPLKTYLPDGDIDLTAFSGSNVEDTLADDMKSILEEEEKNMAAEFVVKDVQLIRAEVKLVKCIVQNIVVDVSFNQIGGVSTLCFLEQVDRLIGKEHLFKRSVILIKAWCYYESRILGAHHGLISTYALETLVLYIFHLFHSTLDGPLAVLFKFLDYFSKFDWDSYCISLNGPICLSSLPAIIVEMPEGCHSNLLLSSDFLSMCVGMFSVPPKGGDRHSRGFQLKHLNIVDPLNETNNLGRSVSKGNFYRIRSAFSYGAKKLALILLQPETSMANELHKFFANTIARHGGGQRPDVYDYGPLPVRNRPISAFSIPESSLCKIDNLHVHRDEHAVANGGSLPSTTLPHDSRAETERRFDVETAKWRLDSNQLSEPAGPRFRGDANDLAISGLGNLTISIESPKSENRRVCMPCDAPHLYFPNSKFCNGGTKDENTDSDKYDRDSSSLVLSGSDEGRVLGNLHKDQLGEKEENMTPSTPNVSGERNHTDFETPDESVNSISDLTGNYDRYLQCLQYARWFCEHALDRLSLHVPPMPSSPYQRSSPRGSFFPMSHFKQNGFHNGLHPRLAMPGMQPVLLPGLAFGWEDGPKPRMGTYFPTTNQPPHGYRPSSMKGRKYAPSNSPRNNVRNMAFSEANSSSHEPSQHQVPVDKTVMDGSSDHHPSFVHSGYPSPNGLVIHQPEGVSQFESMSEKTRQHKPVSSSPRTQNSQPTLSKEQDRISLRSSYRLKDEDDFPPLSV